MLFLQGTRDAFAELTLLEPVVKSLGQLATLHLVKEADHSLHVPARSGRNDREVLDEVLDALAAWIDEIATHACPIRRAQFEKCCRDLSRSANAARGLRTGFWRECGMLEVRNETALAAEPATSPEWTAEAAWSLYRRPFNDLLFRAPTRCIAAISTPTPSR